MARAHTPAFAYFSSSGSRTPHHNPGPMAFHLQVLPELILETVGFDERLLTAEGNHQYGLQTVVTEV